MKPTHLLILAWVLPSSAQRFNTTTIINSNCPCDRSRFKYCYSYTRPDVLDHTCYDISSPSWSMRAYDPRASLHDRLVCVAYALEGCRGRRSAMAAWSDNTRCVEPTLEVDAREPEVDEDDEGGKERKSNDFAWWYRSFECHHP